MNYVSGLMLGASLVNMLRQSAGGAGGMNAGFAQGMGGGRGRSMQGGGASGFSSAAGGLALGGAALTGLLGGGRMGGGASPLTSLLGMAGRGGRAQLPLGFFDGGRKGGHSSAGMAQESAPAPTQMKVSAEPPFVCVHASAGRRRYRTPYLTEAFAKVLEERLARLPFVTGVRANATAGSILLTYEPEDEAHILMRRWRRVCAARCMISADGSSGIRAVRSISVRWLQVYSFCAGFASSCSRTIRRPVRRCSGGRSR